MMVYGRSSNSGMPTIIHTLYYSKPDKNGEEPSPIWIPSGVVERGYRWEIPELKRTFINGNIIQPMVIFQQAMFDSHSYSH